MKGHHQRWLALAWFALCASGSAFLLFYRDDRSPWLIATAVALVAVGLIGSDIAWQNSRSKRTSPRAEIRRLRADAPRYVAAGLLALTAAYFTHGLLVTARADTWPRAVEGTGTATSCDRDWRYLTATWRCTVDITANTGEQLTQTMAHSQFTDADLGRPKPVTFTGSEWEAMDQPREHRFAKALLVLLLAAGTALLAKPLYDLSRIRDLENPGLPPRFLRTG